MASCLNILWIFLSSQLLVVLFVIQISSTFPQVMPPRHAFVIDSAEFIEEIYFYGSGPAEIDQKYIEKQWYKSDTDVG